MDEAIFIRPDEGERIGSHRVLGELPHVEAIELVYGADFEGVDPHTHTDHTDSFYVLEGEIEFFFDGEWHRTGPGAFVSVPPNVPHGFRPAGGNFRVLNFHTPNVGFVGRLRRHYAAV
ncbi:MAG: cupin domain-containing protein [Gaiellaceae bacterium]